MDAIAYSEAQIRVAYKRVKELENLLKVNSLHIKYIHLLTNTLESNWYSKLSR
jgi:hypothetical protein